MRIVKLLVWFMIGAAPGYFGLQYFSEAQSYVARSIETPATILDFRYEDAGLADHTDNDFRMWVEYTYVDGSTVSSPTNVSTSNKVERIGDPIIILYDPQNVGTVRVKSFMSLYLLPAIFLGFAGVIWVFGIFRSLT